MYRIGHKYRTDLNFPFVNEFHMLFLDYFMAYDDTKMSSAYCCSRKEFIKVPGLQIFTTIDLLKFLFNIKRRSINCYPVITKSDVLGRFKSKRSNSV